MKNTKKLEASIIIRTKNEEFKSVMGLSGCKNIAHASKKFII